MTKKRLVCLERHKLNNALYNLAKYINFLEILAFVIFGLAFFIGAIIIFFSLVHSSYNFLPIGVFVFLISAAVHIFLIKPLLLIMYAVSKLLLDTKKHTE